MNKTKNINNSIKLILGLFLIIFLVAGGTYAYYTWTSSNDKLVLLNTSKELSEYIIYDEGESKFVGDFKIGDSYLDGVHTTISIYKTEEAADIDLYATINMYINSIGENIRNSNAVKWTVTKGNSTNPGQIIAEDNFYRNDSETTIPLCTSIEVTTTEEEYTIWIWIDESENPDSKLTGETLDTVIWTQVEQTTGERFEIMKLSNRPGKINAEVINDINIITNYAITRSENEPTEWVEIPVEEQSQNYVLEYEIEQFGTYYIWFKDSEGKITSKSIEIVTLETLPPTGTLAITPNSNILTATINAQDTSGIKDLYGWKITTSKKCDSSITNFEETIIPTYTFSVNQDNIYYLCCRYEDNSGNYGYTSKIIPTTSINYVYTGNEQTFTAPESGYYKIETWGASGGSSNNEGYGLGAYASGIIRLEKSEIIYINPGSQGVVASTSANVKTGGQATDIRLISGSSNESINSRIMVAAGGGSVTSYLNEARGGHGGTLIGQDGVAHTDVAASGNYIGYKGTQTSGGAIGTSATSGTAGGFGYGGTGGVGPGDPAHNGSNGGGGYYGGGGSAWHAGSGGGSSFVSGYSGVNAITSSTSRTHTNNTLHYSNKYFLDGKMQAGVNTGNGKAKITYYGNELTRINSKLDNVRYIKDCINGSTANTGNHWIELQAIYNGINIAKGKTISSTGSVSGGDVAYVTNGIIDNSSEYIGIAAPLQCITIDLGTTYNLDEIAVWHYYADGRTYNENITYTSTDGNTWKKAIAKIEVETANGKRVSAYEIDLTDEDAPTGTLSTSINYNVITASFTNASDNGGTGISTYQYLITTESTCPTTGYTETTNSSYAFTTNSTGTYLICAKIKDKIGNITNPITKTVTVTTVSPTPIYTYLKSDGTTANHQYFDEGNGNWRIEFYEDGTLNVTYWKATDNLIDIFLVGGGAGGNKATNFAGGAGGGGGYTKTITNFTVYTNTNYPIDIGDGGNQNNAGLTTTAFNNFANGGKPGINGSTSTSSYDATGGAGGSGGGAGGHAWKASGYITYYHPGNGGTNGGNGGARKNDSSIKGGTGQGTPTCAFGVQTCSAPYSGGGAGGQGAEMWTVGSETNTATGGAIGGGNSGKPGTANTGGGGGGGNCTSTGSGITYGNGGKGGSGIVIIRNKR